MTCLITGGKERLFNKWKRIKKICHVEEVEIGFLPYIIPKKKKINSWWIKDLKVKNQSQMIQTHLPSMLTKLRALMRYSSYTIQFTHLKNKIQCFLVHSQIHATITTVNFRTFSSSQKETLSLSPAGHSDTPPHPPTTNLFLVSIVCSAYFIQNMWHFVTGFFHLA